LCAADTFRAAAIEQLEIWGERSGARVIRQNSGSDPSAVLFDALQAARANQVDYVIVDTAGRLQTKENLMAELQKMSRTAKKVIPDAPHEVLLVLDATTGQNGLEQARKFTETSGVTGIALTKLDGTAKGGIVVAIARELDLPIRYIGVGEKADDLLPFDSERFIESLFSKCRPISCERRSTWRGKDGRRPAPTRWSVRCSCATARWSAAAPTPTPEWPTPKRSHWPKQATVRGVQLCIS